MKIFKLRRRLRRLRRTNFISQFEPVAFFRPIRWWITYISQPYSIKNRMCFWATIDSLSGRDAIIRDCSTPWFRYHQNVYLDTN
jgi:hypothetical protein